MAPASGAASDGSIYSYETTAGTRWRFIFRDSRGRADAAAAASRAAARPRARARAAAWASVHRGEVRVSRETLAGYWERYLHARRPYLEDGSWQDYRRHGERAHPPPPRPPQAHVAHRAGAARLARRARRDRPVGAQDAQQRAQGARRLPQPRGRATGCCPRTRPRYVQALPLGHIERDYLRLHEIGLYLDACSDVYRPLAETLIGTGMRISEALALNVADLDLHPRRDRRLAIAQGRRHRSARPRATASAASRSAPAHRAARRTTPHGGSRRPPSRRTRCCCSSRPIRETRHDKGRWPSSRRSGRSTAAPSRAAGTRRRCRTPGCATCRCTRCATPPPRRG